MLKSDIFIGQRVGFFYKGQNYYGTILKFHEDDPENLVQITLDSNEVILKPFKKILGLLE